MAPAPHRNQHITTTKRTKWHQTVVIDTHTAFAQGFLATVTARAVLARTRTTCADQHAQSGLHINTALGENGDATYLLLRLHGL